MRRSLWVGVAAVAVAAVIGVGQLFLFRVQPAFAILLDSEFADDFIQSSVNLSYDGY